MGIKVLVVDDSALVRQVLVQGLSSDPEIEVVGVALDPYVARDRIVQLRPDVLTLDVEMPRMDGVEFLKRLMPAYPLPTVMVSSLTPRGGEITLNALAAGAIDFVTKPSSMGAGLNEMMAELIRKVKMAAKVDVSHWKGKKEAVTRPAASAAPKVLKDSTDKVIAIGASTGGTEALAAVLTQLPPQTPGIVLTQHMPKNFTRLFAERLDRDCQMQAKEAEDGDRIIRGRILVAPGAKQMKVVRSGGIYEVKCAEGEKVNGHSPSVDVLFNSVAEQVGCNAYGVILTGMGRDGASGLLKMRNNGAHTIGQDEASSVVYGMPKEAYDLGAVVKQCPLNEVAGQLLRNL
ncbi:MAG: chemotaxis response regulator protein-glutamate methylesterase [Planctomycetes bacterium]|nr:chemotaxis response regulator protein-glutamate methylesterase [Planctomycetota bacterium]